MPNNTLFYGLFLLFIGISCQSLEDQQSDQTAALVSKTMAKAKLVGNKEFDEYWYQGLAELNSYTLEQARYGEIHQGESVMVFVTEPFSLSKQVKLDNPGATPKDAVSVMKLNFTKKFYTGLYPYSIMQSSFTPVDQKKFPQALKVTTSSQEWCGHTFTQYNLKEKGYHVIEHSYFESEGETEKQLDRTPLEDEIWSKIRINPQSLPTGELELIPSAVFARLRHTGIQKVKAIASLSTSTEDKDWMTYQIKYPSLNRNLTIHFSNSFPHQIQGWEESYQSGFGPNVKMLTTKAKLKKTIQLDYWTKNSVADGKYRKELELEGF